MDDGINFNGLVLFDNDGDYYFVPNETGSTVASESDDESGKRKLMTKVLYHSWHMKTSEDSPNKANLPVSRISTTCFVATLTIRKSDVVDGTTSSTRDVDWVTKMSDGDRDLLLIYRSDPREFTRSSWSKWDKPSAFEFSARASRNPGTSEPGETYARTWAGLDTASRTDHTPYVGSRTPAWLHCREKSGD